MHSHSLRSAQTAQQEQQGQAGSGAGAGGSGSGLTRSRTGACRMSVAVELYRSSTGGGADLAVGIKC